MIHFEKVREIKDACRRVVNNNDLLVSLFESMPDLHHFRFMKTQEYDDNNYFDDIKVTEINGHSYGYEGYDEDYEGIYPRLDKHEIKTSDLPKVCPIHVEHAVQEISSAYDYSDNDVEVRREDYQRSEPEDVVEKTYLGSYLSGSKIRPSFFFKKKRTKWATYYALDHGRFGEDDEFKIFAKKGEMYYALEYARHVIKGRLPSAVENFFVLDPDDVDDSHIKQYVEEFMALERVS